MHPWPGITRLRHEIHRDARRDATIRAETQFPAVRRGYPQRGNCVHSIFTPVSHQYKLRKQGYNAYPTQRVRTIITRSTDARLGPQLQRITRQARGIEPGYREARGRQQVTRGCSAAPDRCGRTFTTLHEGRLSTGANGDHHHLTK